VTGRLVAVIAALAAILLGATSSVSAAAVAGTRVGASAPVVVVPVGPPEHIGAGQRLGNDPAGVADAVATGVAAETGGAASVRLGQAGESAVRSAYDIGPKASADIAGRTRIFDGLTDTTVSEVKNVARQSFTLQLRDSLSYAQSTGRTFDLYVRQDTYLTGPLREAIGRGDINLRFIP
jgi:hypothetical protein